MRSIYNFDQCFPAIDRLNSLKLWKFDRARSVCSLFRYSVDQYSVKKFPVAEQTPVNMIWLRLSTTNQSVICGLRGNFCSNWLIKSKWCHESPFGDTHADCTTLTHTHKYLVLYIKNAHVRTLASNPPNRQVKTVLRTHFGRPANLAQNATKIKANFYEVIAFQRYHDDTIPTRSPIMTFSLRLWSIS